MIRPALRDIEVYLCVEPVGFRKQFNGLSMLVESELSLDPLSSAVFAFTNRRRDRVKLLVWENNGFVLWLKRLERELSASRNAIDRLAKVEEKRIFFCRPDAEARFAKVYEAKFGEKPPRPTE